eukprot:CAMPEP_0116971742 /NCGR_PEP_ID=MMETSP0467-20121206/53390_1 /TAXON_ID=283647 /ORGANISM="Mesodinium pulex, Strain SPMC105" /LENGTH=62 /DNA_ID=CAMNT_0004663025 /DNA_START=75 /DNA_END=263 /DNA_ORIENTATION=-
MEQDFRENKALIETMRAESSNFSFTLVKLESQLKSARNSLTKAGKTSDLQESTIVYYTEVVE